MCCPCSKHTVSPYFCVYTEVGAHTRVDTRQHILQENTFCKRTHSIREHILSGNMCHNVYHRPVCKRAYSVFHEILKSWDARAWTRTLKRKKKIIRTLKDWFHIGYSSSEFYVIFVFHNNECTNMRTHALLQIFLHTHTWSGLVPRRVIGLFWRVIGLFWRVIGLFLHTHTWSGLVQRQRSSAYLQVYAEVSKETHYTRKETYYKAKETY